MKEWLNVDTGEFKTPEDDIVIKGINWVKVPEDAEEYYWHNNKSCCFFLKNIDGEKFYQYLDESMWLKWHDFNEDCLNQFKLKWKREKPKGTFDSVSSVVNHSLHDNVDHPKHYVSDPCVVNGKTISDGGSSSYYFTKLPKHVIDEINRTGGVEIKDIARYVYDNNADAFNIIKAQKRIIEDLKGLGKLGADAKYDAKKILFFAEEQYKQIIEGVKIND